MGERPLGVLLLGGNRTHQENYGRAFAADPRCRLIAVADEADAPPERHALNAQLATELELPYLPNLEQALARSEVDLASVCVEHERRARVAVRCAAAGKHLYLDKPSACTVPGARAIAAAAEQHRVRSQVFSFVHTPLAASARRVLEDGAVGELRAVHLEILFAKGRPGSARLGSPRRQEPFPNRFTFPDSKRELRATGVYAVSLALWLLRASIVSVYGVTENYFFAEHQENGAEDFGLMSLGFDTGVTATVTAGRIGATSHRRGGPQRVTLVGDNGMVILDGNRPRLEVCTAEPPWIPGEPDPEDPMSFWRSTQVRAPGPPRRDWIPARGEGESPGDAAAFVDCVLEDRDPAVTARDGAAAVTALMAAYVSAARGEPVCPAEIAWPEDSTLPAAG